MDKQKLILTIEEKYTAEILMSYLPFPKELILIVIMYGVIFKGKFIKTINCDTRITHTYAYKMVTDETNIYIIASKVFTLNKKGETLYESNYYVYGIEMIPIDLVIHESILYVLDESGDRIILFSIPNLKSINYYKIDKFARNIQIVKSEIYVLHTNHINVYTITGKKIRTIDFKEFLTRIFKFDVDKKNLYIATNKIMIFTNDGKYLYEFNKDTNPNGRSLSYPMNAINATENYLYFCDNQWVYQYTKTGQKIKKWRTSEKFHTNFLFLDGHCYVRDLTNKISIFE